MATNGKCPRCAFKAPVSCFVDSAESGELLQAFAQLPKEVQQPYFKYLSLFRPASGRAIQGAKAVRLTQDLAALVNKGFVSKKGKVDRSCYPSLWAMGMEKMQENAATLTLPMETHGYLQTVVYQLADQADSRHEQKQRQNEMNGNARSNRIVPPPSSGGEELSQLERQYLERHGHLPGMDGEDVPSMQDLEAWKKKAFASPIEEQNQ